MHVHTLVRGVVEGERGATGDARAHRWVWLYRPGSQMVCGPVGMAMHMAMHMHMLTHAHADTCTRCHKHMLKSHAA